MGNFMGYNSATELFTAIGNKIRAKYTKPQDGIPKADLTSGVQSSLDKADNAVTMVGSGTGHKGGLVPDPPATAGASKYLREDGTWAEPAGGGGAVTGVKGNTESAYRTGDVNLTPANIGAATSDHTHGNITNDGKLQTTDVSIASGDKLVITDSSNSSKIARASISFDGSTTSKGLTPAGTWQTFLTSHQSLSGYLKMAYYTSNKTSGSLNDLSEGRVYCSSSVTGGPVSSVSMIVETISDYYGSYKTQVATIMSGIYIGCSYMRYYDSGTWSIWFRNVGVGNPSVSSANMNNFTTAGTYYCGTSSTNGPMANVASILEVTRGDDDNILQRCTVVTSGIRQHVTYQRIRKSGTWYKWVFQGPNFADYKVQPNSVTWTKSGGGLYYYTLDLSSSWELIMSATIASWQSIKNYGLSCSISGSGSTSRVGLLCCVPDGSAPSFASGSEIWIRVVGYTVPTT